jgi:hypothetical protein
MKIKDFMSFMAIELLAFPSETALGFRAIFQRRRHICSSNDNKNPPATTRKTNLDYEVVAAPDYTKIQSPGGLKYLPSDVTELFDQIRLVSPLAKMLLITNKRVWAFLLASTAC